MSVADWLNPSPSATSDFSFEVTDLEETSEVPSSADLVALLNESYWGEDYLADLAARYGFSEVREKFLKARVGTLLSVKRGDFGEAVTVDYLSHVTQLEGQDVLDPTDTSSRKPVVRRKDTIAS